MSWEIVNDRMAAASPDREVLAALSDAVERWLDERLTMPPDGEWGVTVWLDLPRKLPFVRPDPYHASLASHEFLRGEPLSESDEALLNAQLARTVGQGMIRRAATPATLVVTPATLVVAGGNAEAVLALCRYLDTCGCLPPTVWLADEPADASILCGQFPSVRTGIRLTSADTAETTKEKLTAYAAVAPIGRVVLGGQISIYSISGAI